MESTKALDPKALARKLAALHEHLQDQPLTFADSTDMETIRQASSFLTALSEQPAPDHAGLATRDEVRQAAKIILRCNGHNLSVWGGDDLHDDSAQDALKELAR